MSTLADHFAEIQAAFERLETCEDEHLRNRPEMWLNLQGVEDDVREIEEYMITHIKKGTV